MTADVDIVVVTHGHLDHIGGLTNDGIRFAVDALLHPLQVEHPEWGRGLDQDQRSRSSPGPRLASGRPASPLRLDPLLWRSRPRQHPRADIRALERLHDALLPGGTLVLDNEKAPLSWRVRDRGKRPPGTPYRLSAQ